MRKSFKIIFLFLIFLLLFLLFLFIRAQGIISGRDIFEICQKTGLQKPEYLLAVWEMESSLGQKIGNVSGPREIRLKKCEDYCYQLWHRKKGKPLQGMGCSKDVATLQRKIWCREQQEALEKVCKEVVGCDINSIVTTPDYGMGYAQFQPTTWLDRKYHSNLRGLNPWDPFQALLAAAIKLVKDGINQNVVLAVSKYNKSREYLEEFYQRAQKWSRKVIGQLSFLVKAPITDIKTILAKLDDLISGCNSEECIRQRIEKEREKRIKEIEEAMKLELEYPEILGFKPEKVKTALNIYIRYIFSFAVIISGLILLGAFIYGGLLYLTSAGDPVKAKMARERLVSSFLGIIILLSGFFILYIINPELTTLYLPKIIPIEEKEVTYPSLPPEEEIPNVVVAELPIGQMIEKKLTIQTKTEMTEPTLGVQTETEVTKTTEKDEKSLFEGGKEMVKAIEEVERSLRGIGSLAKTLEGLSRECRCDDLKGLCTKPFNFSVPVGCVGDPCKKVRKDIDEVTKQIQEKGKKFSEAIKKLTSTNEELINSLSNYHNVEQKVFSCNNQEYGLKTFAEHLVELDLFEKKGWKVKTITLPGAKPSVGDPLTFYCTVGGSHLDYLRRWPEEISPLTQEEIEELKPKEKMSCPVEIPLGQFLDQTREQTILLALRSQRVIHYLGELNKKLEKLNEYVALCTDKNCRVNCCCVPNPCYRCCSPKCTICVPFCRSPCLQAVGGCYGKPCPYDEIEKVIIEIKENEDKIFENISLAKEKFTKISFFVKELEEPINIKNLREVMASCVSPDIKNPTIKILTCDQARGNYGPDGTIMMDCHPRNFYCCILPGQETKMPKQLSQIKQPVFVFRGKQYKPLPPDPNQEGCPKGWKCDPGVGKQYQADHASQPLKELLACLRENLDQVQKEKEIKEPIGRISNISDNKILEGGCKWETGFGNLCSHKHEGDKISCHYGGKYCHYQQKSYAIDFGARPDLPSDNPEEILSALKKCEPRAQVLFHPYQLHISLGEIYQCGCSEDLSTIKDYIQIKK